MKPSWSELLAAAREEVESTLSLLPEPLREAARALPVSYQRRPSAEMVADGLDDDLLGLFVGDSHAEGGAGSALPSQILLFLENLWEFAEGDWGIFEEEVQTTYLHELGHYLGLDELDLEERGLE
ncbi:MAG: metallopeptidase family protein [Verrucomicrobiae bacterium]|nr:metallopeptidase family protein [Verrucomicrobiae bacterium]